MQKNGGKARTKDLKEYVRRVESKLKAVKPPKMDSDGTGRSKTDKLKTFLSKSFTFEGYIKPKVENVGTGGPAAKAKAPALSTLVEVHMVLAPEGGESTGVSSGPSSAGAFVQIKSVKADQFSTYWYRVGETIGEGQDHRADIDPMLKKWGPCVLLRVTDDGIVCSWNKEEDEGIVQIQREAEPTNAWVEGPGVKVGGPGVINKTQIPKGVITPASLGISLFRPGKTRKGDSIIELTKEGLDLFDRGEGEKLLGEIGTKKSSAGLEVTSIPKRFQEFGLQPGDVVIKVDNTSVKNKATVTNYVRKNYRKKNNFSVTVLRNGKQKMFNVKVPKKTSGLGNAGRGVKFGQ